MCLKLYWKHFKKSVWYIGMDFPLAAHGQLDNLSVWAVQMLIAIFGLAEIFLRRSEVGVMFWRNEAASASTTLLCDTALTRNLSDFPIDVSRRLARVIDSAFVVKSTAGGYILFCWGVFVCLVSKNRLISKQNSLLLLVLLRWCIGLQWVLRSAAMLLGRFNVR